MNILIAGGYGVVGAQVAELLRRRNPSLGLTIAGRSPDKARALASSLGHAGGAAFDVNDPASVSRLPERPSLVLLAVNDLRDVTARSCLAEGIPVVDITRWTARVRDLEALCRQSPPRAPVVQGSSWMACIPGALARAEVEGWETVESIELSILYSLSDRSGEDSVEYMDRLHLPFPVTRRGRGDTAVPFVEHRRSRFASDVEATVYRFDTPDQHILPRRSGAASVAAYIAFDDRTTTTAFWLLVRSGLWGLLSGERFTSLRRSLLHSPGSGGPHHVRVDLAGRRDGHDVRTVLQLADPRGQTHLTALGAALQAEWVLGLRGFSAPGPGLVYGEDMGPIAIVEAALAEEGVVVLRE